MASDTDRTSPAGHDASYYRQDTTKMAYSSCNTRIVSLLKLPSIPSAKDTADETYRELYRDYIRSARRNPEQSITNGEKLSVQGESQSLQTGDFNAENARFLSDAVTSLTTGISPPVAFPTETVYGLGADATNPASIAGIFAAKGRPSDNPLIVHVSSASHLERCLGGTNEKSAIPEVYQDLVKHFWPGPLTILIPVPDNGKGVTFAPNVHPGQSTIGFRVPESGYARFLIAAADRPIAAPSANSSGKPSPTAASHVRDDLHGKINFILDGGTCDVGVESTVVDGLGEVPLILRPGGLSKIKLREWGRKMNNVWQHVENGWEKKKGTKRKRDNEILNLEKATTKAARLATKQDQSVDMFESPATRSPVADHEDLALENESKTAPRAPGMKYKHYSPSGHMYLFERDDNKGSSTTLEAFHHKFGKLLDAKVSEVNHIAGEGQQNGGANAISSRNATGTQSSHPQYELRIAVLSSTSWPAYADLPSRLKDLKPTWDSEAPLKRRTSELEMYELIVHPKSAGSRPWKISIVWLPLGGQADEVARNLFAALRKCDSMHCDWIFAEAPTHDRANVSNSGHKNSQSQTEIHNDDDEFETVLERMRKAASELVLI